MTTTQQSAQLDSERRTPLDITASTFRALGHRLVDDIATFLESLPVRPVARNQPPSGLREALGLGGPLPERGTDPAALLERTASLLFDNSLFNGHPRFYGYITSSPSPIGILGELLAAAINSNVGSFVLSPAATEIESETVRWIAEFIGYPTECGGLLVSGGNMANMVCSRGAGSKGGLERSRARSSWGQRTNTARLLFVGDAHLDQQSCRSGGTRHRGNSFHFD
jgi:aromatic-L-amino-acid/L-tryptophan decarboxylase